MLKERFFYFATASVIIGLVAGVILSGTYGGLPVTIFLLVYEAFLYHTVKKINGDIWPESRSYLIYMVLLSITMTFTSNRLMLVTTSWGVVILMILFLYHQFNTDENWGFKKTFGKVVEACLMPISRMGRIYSDAGELRNEGRVNSIYIHIIAGVAIAIPLTMIMGGILMSADGLFESVMNRMFGWVDFGFSMWNLIKFVFVTMLAYGFFSFMLEEHEEGAAPIEKKHQPVTAIIAYGVLTAMYMLFCLVQFSYLFIHEGSELYHYAQGAREGFFKLTFVGFINLVLVINGISLMRKSKVLDIIMLIMSGCTYIMMISATVRMFRYVRAYHMTQLRLYVTWAIIVIAIIFVGVIKNILNEKFNLFRHALHSFTIMFIVLAVLRPDFMVMYYNLNMVDDYDDFKYVAYDICIDAVPLLVENMDKYADNDDYIEMLESFEIRVKREKEDEFVKGGYAEWRAVETMKIQ